jgi:DNA-binding NarL/FixJ family response regulator
MFASTGRWHVIGEAADGVSAIQSVRALCPDVVLLDVELAGLSGIETARRILAVERDTKILFMSAHRSWDIAQIALDTGARGYLLKSDAGHELVTALDVVAAGGWFISGVLVGRSRARKRSQEARRARVHEVAFYSDPMSRLDALARFTAGALGDEKIVAACIVGGRREAFHERLSALGVDVDRAIHMGRYLPVDVSELIAGVMIGGQPDETRLWKMGASLLARAARSSKDTCPRVALCGEGCAVLVDEGRVDAAVRLEHLWDEFAKACNIDVFCVHSTRGGDREEDGETRRKLTAEHSSVHGAS